MGAARLQTNQHQQLLPRFPPGVLATKRLLNIRNQFKEPFVCDFVPVTVVEACRDLRSEERADAFVRTVVGDRSKRRSCKRPNILILVIECFTIAQADRPTGPSRPAHLALPGELPEAFDALETLEYREDDDGERAVARLCARKPMA